jgi:hypothetical protein
MWTNPQGILLVDMEWQGSLGVGRLVLRCGQENVDIKWTFKKTSPRRRKLNTIVKTAIKHFPVQESSGEL